MTTKPCFPELTQFRQELYQNFNNRADTLMELVDAICSNPHARSVVEYSLTPCFRRSYSTLFKALAEETWAEQKHLRTLAPYLPKPKDRPFWLLGVDVTPQPRPFAKTLSDRGMVYQPNTVAGNKPVTVGHAYSCVSLLPEPEAQVSSSWVVPLLMRRVGTHEDKEIVGANQIATLLDDEQLPWAKAFCVDVGDTSYSKPAYLHSNRHQQNLVTLTRVCGTRTFYQQPVIPDQEKSPGHPTWYGQPFSLKDASTWPEPAETLTLTETSRRGKTYRVQIQAWPNLLMRGQQQPERLAMHHHPFTRCGLSATMKKGNRFTSDLCGSWLWERDAMNWVCFRFIKPIANAITWNISFVLANNGFFWLTSRHLKRAGKKPGGAWCPWFMTNSGWHGMWCRCYPDPGSATYRP